MRNGYEATVGAMLGRVLGNFNPAPIKRVNDFALIMIVRFEDTEMPVLQTANLILSPCSPDDGADFIDLERDPDVMHFLNGGAVDHENIDPNNVTFLMPRGKEPYVWTARRKENGEFVGWFCLFPENEKLAEIGYRLRRQDWGQGLASEGAAALVSWGFNIAGLGSPFNRS